MLFKAFGVTVYLLVFLAGIQIPVLFQRGRETGVGKCGNMYVREKERTVSCGECGGREKGGME